MPPADDPPEADDQRRAALLAHVQRRLVERQSLSLQRARPLFRVVEVARDPHGRLRTRGQVWHSDLDHVRRFGHALGGNSTAQRVEITDAKGAVVEQIPVCGSAGQATGWAGWRERPLPPLPPRPKPQRLPPMQPAPAPAVAVSAPPPLPPPPPVPPPALAVDRPVPGAAGATASTSPGPTAAKPPRDIPVVEHVSFDPEATAPLSPAPPP